MEQDKPKEDPFRARLREALTRPVTEPFRSYQLTRPPNQEEQLNRIEAIIKERVNFYKELLNDEDGPLAGLS